jgi:hypothetical protein
VVRQETHHQLVLHKEIVVHQQVQYLLVVVVVEQVLQQDLVQKEEMEVLYLQVFLDLQPLLMVKQDQVEDIFLVVVVADPHQHLQEQVV